MRVACTIAATEQTCDPEPAIPNAADDKAVAHFIMDAVNAGRDCRNKLNEVVNFVKKDCSS